MEHPIDSMPVWGSDPSTSPGSVDPEASGHAILHGDRMGDFHLERRLGVGAMGEVFAATREGSAEPLALKVLRATSPTRFYRFKREFRALADITHPNLVGLRELFVPVDGPAFFTMELVEGEPFTAYVRRDAAEGGLPDLERLQAALVQLVRGVHHLHHARCIHRDLKPSNVLVTATGRVVILDFGLVSEQVGSDAGITGDGQMLGTPAYMAPEQADAETGPAVDYYAIGVMLYECLTGTLPFSGPPMKIILLKQDREAPDPAASGLGVPVYLRELCMRLLQRDPTQRPTGREILERLDGRGGRSTDASRTLGDTRVLRRVPFVGRAAEQQILETALARVTERGASITVHVHGRSGYGKSALVARLLAQARADDRALVLAGRCYERVWVSYKGVDTVVDALSLHLRRMSPEQRAEVRPRHIGPLAQIFPVLGDIWEPARVEGWSTAGALEPTEQRRLGLAALRELLGRLGSKRPLVMLIDDLQWSNLDGVSLLTSIMRPPDPPALLLLLVFRDERADNPVLRALTDPAALEGRDVQEVEVGPLAEAPALELARALARRDEDQVRALEVVRYAGGSPFFIGQLLVEDQRTPATVTTPDRIVVARLADLAPEARRVLTVVGVASGPVPLAVLAELLPRAQVQRQIDELTAVGLVAVKAREVEHGAAELLVETSHNRIREVALAELDATERRELHLELATAFEIHQGDPETLAGHYAQGGDLEQAAVHTERAAERAAETLAFARAVELYRRTLELLPPEVAPERLHRIRRALARQLVNVGHGAEAAALLLELATTAEPGEARALRREASHQLARSGRIDESIALTVELLRDIGEPAPSTRTAAIAAFLRERARLWLRGWKYEVRTEAQVAARELERLDTLLTVIDGQQEVMVAMALHARALPLALDAGEPRRLGKALAHEISIQAGRGRHQRARVLAIEAQELALLAQDAELDVELEMSSIDIDWLSYQHQRAYERLGGLLARVDEVPSVGPIRSHLVVRRVEAAMAVGRFAELRRELPSWIASARDQGNRQELAALEAHAATVALHYDDLAEARRHLDAGRRAWAASRYTFASAILDNAEIALFSCSGAPSEALARIEVERLALRRGGLDRFRRTVDILDRLHCGCLVQQLLREPTSRSLTAEVKAMTRRWHRSKDPAHRGQAHANEATLASLVGDVVGARRAWRWAQEINDGAGMRAHLAATRVRLAAVTSEHESRRLTALANAYLEDEGITARERFVDALAPAAPLER